MTTVVSTPQSTLVGPLMQLVLFPELFEVDGVPLHVEEQQGREEKRPFSIEAAIATGQLLLFPLTNC